MENHNGLGLGNNNIKIKNSDNSINNSNRGSEISSLKKNKINQKSSDMKGSIEIIKNDEIKTKRKASFKRMKTYDFGISKISTVLTMNHNIKANLNNKSNSNITDINLIQSLFTKKDSLINNSNINDTTKLNENYGSNQYSPLFHKKKVKSLRILIKKKYK